VFKNVVKHFNRQTTAQRKHANNLQYMPGSSNAVKRMSTEVPAATLPPTGSSSSSSSKSSLAASSSSSYSSSSSSTSGGIYMTGPWLSCVCIVKMMLCLQNVKASKL